MTVSERLVAWRKARSISQRRAAELAGVCQPTLSDLEAGTAKRVSVDTAMAIERFTEGDIRVAEWEGIGGGAVDPMSDTIPAASAPDEKAAG